MKKRSYASKLVKIGEEQEEFAVQAKPIPVQIHRTTRDRIVDAIITVTIAVVANVIVTVFVL